MSASRRFQTVSAALLFTCLSAGAEAAPAFRILVKKSGHTAAYYESGDNRVTCDTGSYSDADVTATVTDLGDNRWRLNVRNVSSDASAKIEYVMFPYDKSEFKLNADVTDDIVYDAFHLGSANKADSVGVGDWSEAPSYPGGLFSPLIIVADSSAARVTAAVNWPPKHVTTQWALNRQIIVYNDQGLTPGESSDYEALQATVTADSSLGEVAWMKAADLYKSWMQGEVLRAGLSPDSPDWMKSVHGFLDINLANILDKNLWSVNYKWDNFKGHFPWVQFWGQMNVYGRGCCNAVQTLDRRFTWSSALSIDLPAFAKDVASSGGHAGYYSRPQAAHLDDATALFGGLTNAEWLKRWIRTENASWNANAFYIDTLGAGDYGDVLTVANLLKDELPRATLIEGALDAYPSAFMVSNSLHYPGREGGPDRTVENLGDTDSSSGSVITTVPFPRLGTYVLNDRLFFNGTSNDGYQWWGPEHGYWVERQAFLLGHKFDNGKPNEDWNDPPKENVAVARAVKLRDAFGWWERRPRYLDRGGLTGIPEGIDVRRFLDEDCTTLFAVDNPERLSKLSFKADGVEIPVSSHFLSIIVWNEGKSAADDPDCDGLDDGIDPQPTVKNAWHWVDSEAGTSTSPDGAVVGNAVDFTYAAGERSPAGVITVEGVLDRDKAADPVYLDCGDGRPAGTDDASQDETASAKLGGETGNAGPDLNGLTKRQGLCILRNKTPLPN